MIERLVTNSFYAITDYSALKAIAILERIFTKQGYAIGDHDFSKFIAIIERITANYSNTLGDYYGGDVIALVERSCADHSYWETVMSFGDSDNCICRLADTDYHIGILIGSEGVFKTPSVGNISSRATNVTNCVELVIVNVVSRNSCATANVTVCIAGVVVNVVGNISCLATSVALCIASIVPKVGISSNRATNVTVYVANITVVNVSISSSVCTTNVTICVASIIIFVCHSTPVVVKPDTVSKSASIKLGITPLKTKGSAPNIERSIHDIATQTKPSLA